MAQKLEAGMPADLHLGSTWLLQFAAVDPVTGAGVASVNISNVALVVAQTGQSSGGPAALGIAPLWVPVALGGE